MNNYHALLNLAQKYADLYSTCTKVAVGSLLVDKSYLDSFESKIFDVSSASDYIPGIYGCNSSAVSELSCKKIGCLRMEKYGEQHKSHRNPEDCRAVHSEIDVISRSASLGIKTSEKAIIVTRYPCESCAKAIIRAKIPVVVYGREQKISEQTETMFRLAGVVVIHVSDWTYEDRTD